MVRRLFKKGIHFLLRALDSLQRLGEANASPVLDRAQPRVMTVPVEKVTLNVNEEFARQVEEFVQQYRPALDELAKKNPREG